MNIDEIQFDGTKILNFLHNKNLSQLAREVGVSRQAISDIVKGRRKPSADLFLKITVALNISITELSNQSKTLSLSV